MSAVMLFLFIFIVKIKKYGYYRNMSNIRIGIHASVSKGYNHSVKYILHIGANTMQIFSGNPRGWHRKPLNIEKVNNFKRLRSRNNIRPLIIHAPYLINIASDKPVLLKKSLNALLTEFTRASELSADYLVLHPGSIGSSTIKTGIKRVISSIRYVLDKTSNTTKFLLENTAGQKNSIGNNLNDLLFIREQLNNRIGFCIDTAHAFQAGYRPDLLISHEASKYAKVIHINDSKTFLGSHSDRHEHIGIGKIGIKGFRAYINNRAWKNNAFILETPWDDKKDKKNIKILKSLKDNSN